MSNPLREGRPLRVLAFMEALTMTGPAKNLVEFARGARRPQGGLPGVEVSVVAYRRPGQAEPHAFIRALEAAEIPFDVIADRRACDFAVFPQIRSILARRKPDLVQTHNTKSHFLIRLNGCWRTTPWVAFHHGYTRENLKMWMYAQCDRVSLPAARHVVTVCGRFAADMRRYGIPPERISVRHNAVKAPPALPAESVESVRREFRLGDAPVILAVGRLSPEKGQGDLLKAVAALRRSHPDLRFRAAVVGDGCLRASLERRIAASGLGEWVVLCGHQRDVAPFYAAAAALALPSSSEGSPNVVLEAMAAGVPVVANAVGGVPEIAADGETALLVGCGDTNAMAEGLARLLLDRPFAARLAARAQEHALANFSPEAYRAWLVALYARILDAAN